MQGLQKQISKTFFQTLEDLKSKENLSLFFADFLTEKEHESLIKRLAIAYWLHKKRDYENIKTNLNVSLKEIEEVKKKLDSNGYNLALKYMEAEEWSNKWSEKFKKLASS
jgi:uncharacterized protein YerC